MQSFSTCCKASVPPFVHAVVPPSEKWRLLRNVTRVTSCIGVAGVSVDGNWDACAQWVYAWLERTFYTVQKVKGGVHFHQHVLQSDDMAGEVAKLEIPYLLLTSGKISLVQKSDWDCGIG